MPEKKTTNSIHEEHRARMQERVARDGLTSLAAHEVLEYLLYFSIPRRDTNPLAHRLIQHFGGFCQVLDASEEELMQVQGIGPASARLLHSFRDVARFYQIQKHKEHPVQLRNAEMCCEYIRPLFNDPKREEFYMIAMNDDYVPLKPSFIENAEKRLAKLDKFFPDEAQAQVTVTVEKSGQTVEIMLRSKDLAMRAEKTDERMEDALADAVDLLTRRVVKYRKRLGTKLTAAAAEIPATEPEESMDIVREKHFALKPCSTEEAILQMNLLGHSFFLYHSTENDKIQVVYRRADGGYGVLIPEA